jgi:hypothetical protein
MSSVSIPPVGRSNNLYSFGVYVPVTVGRLNNCNNTLCYTYNHSYIYKPHTGYGSVGTTSAAYLASRKKL